MARILVANGYFYRLDPKQWRDGRPYPPLGTLQAAAVLREAGHEVHVFDACLRRSPGELAPVLRDLDPDVFVIHDDGFNYLTKMCLTVMRDAALDMVRLAKEAGCFVTVNSSDSTDHPDLYLNGGSDVVITGEGEITLLEVVERFVAGSPFRDVPGVVIRIGGQVHHAQKRPVLKELDALPMPAWDLIDIAPYRERWMRSHGYFSLNVATTRGCPFKCNWCAKPIYGNRYNSRSPQRVVEEITWLHRHFAPDHLWMCDDIFGLKPGWVGAFRNALEAAGIRVPFKIQSRADLLLEGDTIDELVACGLQEVWIGAESGSQRILDAMDKGITVEQIATARRLLRERGVRVGFFLQFGYLGETDMDIAATLDMLDDLRPDDIGISVSYPLPGTVFHEKVRNDLSGKANWSDSDDLAMLFRGTHRPGFYKRLHRYVHKRFRRAQAMEAWRALARTGGPGKPDLRTALSAAYYVPAAVLDGIRMRRWREQRTIAPATGP